MNKQTNIQTELMVSYFGHIMRKQYPLEKTMMPSGKRGRQWGEKDRFNKGSTALSFQDLTSSVDDRTFWKSLICSATIH